MPCTPTRTTSVASSIVAVMSAVPTLSVETWATLEVSTQTLVASDDMKVGCLYSGGMMFPLASFASHVSSWLSPHSVRTESGRGSPSSSLITRVTAFWSTVTRTESVRGLTVARIQTEPFATAVTLPVASTVATAGLADT